MVANWVRARIEANLKRSGLRVSTDIAPNEPSFFTSIGARRSLASDSGTTK